MQLSCIYLKSTVFLHLSCNNNQYMNLTLKNQSDSIGIISSALCLAHCLATPLLFAAQSQIINFGNTKPLWWSSLDLILLLISSLAIYKTTLSTTKKWIKNGLWLSFFILSFIIINEKIGWFHIPEAAIYIPSMSLIFLHIYNSKFCSCRNESCCVKDTK